VLHGAGARLATTAWRRWFLDRQADFWLGELNATWSLSARRARVLAVIDETPAARSFVLAPGRRWPGHRAGQFVPIEVELAGVRVRRCYSISSGASAPGARRITITVQRVPGGRVSGWLHDNLRAGDVIGLGAPAGDFVVDAPGPLLLVAGGSGITPVMAILRDLEAHAALDDVVVVHAALRDEDAIFGRELAAFAIHAPGLRLVARRDDRDGRLDPSTLGALVPDLAARAIYACGPAGLLDVVTRAAADVGAADRVHVERFVAAPRPASTGEAVVVTTETRQLALDGNGSLLEQLERAGEQPAYGCRMGICNSCRCRKRAGTVEDLGTGAISSEPDEDIRLCMSRARSDLTLAL
jgi:ferredoxin-NADP reductase